MCHVFFSACNDRWVSKDEEGKDGGGDDDDEGEEGGEYISRNSRLMLMLEDELPNCHNQERVDEFAVRHAKFISAVFDCGSICCCCCCYCDGCW